MFVRMLLNEIFGSDNFCNEIVVGKTPGKKKTGLSLSYTKDYILFYGVTLNNIIKESWKKTERFLFYYEIGSILEKEKNINTEKIKEILREKLFWVDLDHRPGERKENKNRTLMGVEFKPPKGRHWIKNQEKLDELYKQGKARIKCKNCGTTFYSENEIKQCCSNPKWAIQIFLDEDSLGDNWTDISGYSQTHKFQTENSEILLKRVIESTSNEGDLVMDFFLGSGTTTAVAHKLKRKWIGVEMGEHFGSIILSRMKKVLAYDKSGISKEKDVKEKYNEKTASGFFKYQILEQYEDTLDNIELSPNKAAQSLFKDEYLLKYFLSYETRENPGLLNIEQLKTPFSYKLKVNLEEVGEPQEMVIDIPETFNYLLGLKVKKVKTRTNGRKYLFILGEKEGKDVAIVWRNYEDKWSKDDFKKDKEFIIKELISWTPHIVYVNGQSVLTPRPGKHTVEIRYIEPEFKKLMG
jgi:adenine-specific DNA-methyltransferase